MRLDLSQIPEEIRKIRTVLSEYPVFLVGGLLRDGLRKCLSQGIPLEKALTVAEGDWDFATSALPEEVLALFRKAGITVADVGAEHGTILAVIDKARYEITTFRYDVVCDGRHAKVRFADTIEEDLARRDFSVNAFSVNLDTGEMLDLFEGLEDLEARMIRAIGDPRERFHEDYLRMLRAVRFAGKIKGEIEQATLEAIRELAPHIEKISPERIREELLKILALPRPSHCFEILHETGLLVRFLPEFDACFGVEQNRWHSDDVARHTLLAVDAMHPRHALLRWALLLHDIGKPACKTFDPEKDDFVFYGHQTLGAEMTERIMRRLRFSTQEIEFAVPLVENHMWNIDPTVGKKAVRRLMIRTRPADIRDFFRLRMADRRGNKKHEGIEPGLRKVIRYAREIEEDEEALDVKDLALGGLDLIELGLCPGPIFSKILDFLLDRVLDEPELNDREKLLGLVEEWKKEHPEEYEAGIRPPKKPPPAPPW